MKERFPYTPGVTTADTTVEQFVAGGAGVCQDFAHPAGRLLRAHDIAARYVKIGHGRFYGDVPPVEGTFTGTASSSVEAHVSMRRLAG